VAVDSGPLGYGRRVRGECSAMRPPALLRDRTDFPCRCGLRDSLCSERCPVAPDCFRARSSGNRGAGLLGRITFGAIRRQELNSSPLLGALVNMERENGAAWKKELKLRIVLKAPPAGVDFGLQKGRRSNYQTVQVQRSGSRDLFFEFALNATEDQRGTRPKLFGPYVQGPPGNRFVYVDIGTFAGQEDSCWSRRLKIPLSGITSGLLKRSANGAPQVLEARVPGKGKDRGPNCGTVKPFDGWKVRSA